MEPPTQSGPVSGAPITSGNGGAGGTGGGNGGDGGTAISFLGANFLSNSSGSVINGGNGGISQSNGGNGGTGVIFNANGTLANAAGASIIGGNGEVGLVQGGNGGTGVIFNAGGILINAAGATITGGNGVSGGSINGTNGAGVFFSGGAAMFTNAGTINGDVVMDNYSNSVTLFTGSAIHGNLNLSTNASSTLTLDGIGSQSYSSAVTGLTTFNGSLIKQGSGTWTIDRALNSVTSTTISAGQLSLTGSGSISGSTIVANGGTLGGGGTIKGDVTVQSGGKLYPGDPAITTVNGNVSLETGATSAFSVNNTATPSPPNKVTAGIDYDQVSLKDTGTASNLTIQSGVTLEVIDITSLQYNSVAYVPTGPNTGLYNNYLYALQTGTISGQFDFFSDGTTTTAITYTDGIGTATLDEVQIYLSYTGNAGLNSTTGGHDFVLTAYSTSMSVPEPSTWALLGLSLAALGFLPRRVSRKN